MDIENGTYTYTDYYGQKHHLPIEAVSSLSQLQKGDHIARKGCFGFLWHHAIVENVETDTGIINVIEYSNSAKGFSQDNSSLPWNPGLAKVKRGEGRLQDGFYVIKHSICLPQDTVVLNAQRKLGERKYHISRNNCEHFAMWCKTTVSSSEQVNIAREKIRKNAPYLVAAAAGNYADESRSELHLLVFDVVLAVDDINCAKQELKAGNISQKEYKKRIVGAFGSVVGSTLGAAVGEHLTLNLGLGDIAGNTLGRLLGRFCGDKLSRAIAN